MIKEDLMEIVTHTTCHQKQFEDHNMMKCDRCHDPKIRYELLLTEVSPIAMEHIPLYIMLKAMFDCPSINIRNMILNLPFKFATDLHISTAYRMAWYLESIKGVKISINKIET